MAGVRRLANALRLVFVVQWRTRFPAVYLALAAITAIALLATPLFELRAWLMPVIQFQEYGTVTLVMVAAHRYFERNERSVTSLVVTPLRGGEYTAALVLGSALVPTVVGSALQLAVLGPGLGIVALVPCLFLTASFCGFVSFALSTRHAEFTHFLMGSLIPATVLLLIPALAYFGFVSWAPFVWTPSGAAILAFEATTAASPSWPTLAWTSGVLLAWNGAAFAWARSAFHRNIRGRLEYA